LRSTDQNQWDPTKCIIAGIGETPFYRDSLQSELGLAATAIRAAAKDAGIAVDEIDGLVSYSLDTSAAPGYLAMNLGISALSYWGAAEGGGNATCAVIAQAVAAIEAGLASTVAVYRSMNGRSGRRFGQAWTENSWVGGSVYNEEYAIPFGVLAPVQVYALRAAEYFRRYGVTSEQLGWIAVVTRQRANENPAAMMHDKTMTIEDHQSSRWIAEPLRLLDCCLETDNAAAVIVTRADRAADLPSPGAAILAAAMTSSPSAHGPVFYAPLEPDLTDTSAHYIAPRLFQMAGLSPVDIDVAQIYDSFTIAVLAQIEAYGFCSVGEGGDFVDGGSRIDLGGELPINTYGGQLSGGYVNGFSGVIEGVRQIRGTSTSQVEDAEVCLVTGGMATTTSAMILGPAT
jgi:acetyl-CoA acetyltransferase